MGYKSKLHSKASGIKKNEHVIAEKISKDLYSLRIGGKKINPILMPERIKKIQNDAVNTDINDILDMKSKKIIEEIGHSITGLSALNPLEEGGYGIDHPGVKGKLSGKKKLKTFVQAEVIENIDDYTAVLQDLKSVMDKLALSRKAIFMNSSKKV